MNNSQMLLILGATAIFSFITINSHRTVLSAADLRLDTEQVITASEIAETMINEIKSKAFDEAVTDSNTVENVTEFTLYMGPGYSEYPGHYDDVDDYITDNKKNRPVIVNTPRTGQFTATVEVKYVRPEQPKTVSAIQTRMKRIRISVTAKRLSKAVVLDSFVSY